MARCTLCADSVSCLSTFQSAAMWEGWSDYFAAAYWKDPVVDEYMGQTMSYDAYPACHCFITVNPVSGYPTK